LVSSFLVVAAAVASVPSSAGRAVVVVVVVVVLAAEDLGNESSTETLLSTAVPAGVACLRRCFPSWLD
jgi:hypothetical protein